jgi:hypothetical protein
MKYKFCENAFPHNPPNNYPNKYILKTAVIILNKNEFDNLKTKIDSIYVISNSPSSSENILTFDMSCTFNDRDAFSIEELYPNYEKSFYVCGNREDCKKYVPQKHQLILLRILGV